MLGYEPNSNFVSIKIRNTFPGSKYAQQKVHKLRTTDKLKLLILRRGN